MDFMSNREIQVHTLALSIAILGPLINLLLGFPYSSSPPGMYFYWAIALLVYIAVLIPFTHKSPLILGKLVILGVAVEDFFSNLWRSLFWGKEFLPFCNWYTQHFPFLGSLGEPMPYILIPRWYVLAFSMYFLITIFQYRKSLEKFLRSKSPAFKNI